MAAAHFLFEMQLLLRVLFVAAVLAVPAALAEEDHHEARLTEVVESFNARPNGSTNSATVTLVGWGFEVRGKAR